MSLYKSSSSRSEVKNFQEYEVPSVTAVHQSKSRDPVGHCCPVFNHVKTNQQINMSPFQGGHIVFVLLLLPLKVRLKKLFVQVVTWKFNWLQIWNVNMYGLEKKWPKANFLTFPFLYNLSSYEIYGLGHYIRFLNQTVWKIIPWINVKKKPGTL